MPSPNARHEICLRMALGAGRTSVLVMVTREALGMASVGTEIGLLLALAFVRLLRDLLYGVRPTDPLIYAAVAATLGAVAVLASYLPARRATKVDPIVALRYE